MVKQNVNINQNVAILCDGNNIELSIHSEADNKNTMINFDTLIPKLLSGRGLNRLIYFREGKAISGKLAERLHQQFYNPMSQNCRYSSIYQGNTACFKSRYNNHYVW